MLHEIFTVNALPYDYLGTILSLFGSIQFHYKK